jgi:predicted TIM-barrel fold metal-dependent hydrolase
MRLIDSQIHLWTDQAAASKMLQQAMSPEEIIAQMDTCGVLRTYLVPGHSGANELCVQAAKKWPDRFKALALLTLDKQASRDIVTQWASSGFVGVRLTFPPYREVSWLDDGTADWFWPLANALALPVMMWAPKRAAAIGELAQRFARIRFIVDHINLFVMDKAEAVEREVSSVLQLAHLPNVAVKVSSLPAHSSEPFPYRDMHGHIERVVQAFGAERAMWGTDLTRMACSYPQAIAMFTEHLPFLNAEQLQSVMAGTAEHWLPWGEA